MCGWIVSGNFLEVDQDCGICWMCFLKSRRTSNISDRAWESLAVLSFTKVRTKETFRHAGDHFSSLIMLSTA